MTRKKDDLRFNRITKPGERQYLYEYARGRINGNNEYDGFIKCKLAHNRGYSLIIPDQIYADIGGQTHWFQPLYYSGCFISNYGTYGQCQLSVDISHCQVLNIQFSTQNLTHRLNDCSLVYRCKIRAPRYIYRYATGKAKLDQHGPRIRLFHHTNQKAKNSILEGGEYRSSEWNIQGTKKLTNIGYLYLTSLPRIEFDEDLGVIAMASDGRLGFRTDLNTSGSPDLVLTVYRESTDKRTETLAHWVDASILSTQPAYRHQHPGSFGYHEVVCPFVHRIGVEHGTTVAISRSGIDPRSPKDFGYAVVGDATTTPGLAAPYDEEHTGDLFKIECIEDGADIIKFWIANANSDQFSNKSFEAAELVAPE